MMGTTTLKYTEHLVSAYHIDEVLPLSFRRERSDAAHESHRGKQHATPRGALLEQGTPSRDGAAQVTSSVRERGWPTG